MWTLAMGYIMTRLLGVILIIVISYASAQDCGGDLNGPNGTVTSPNWPGKYPKNAFCRWTIKVEEDNTVELEFINFVLQEPDRTYGCLDFVKIADGEMTYGPYCGSVVPPQRKSKANKLVITFRTDEYENYRGFIASYKEVRKSPITTNSPLTTNIPVSTTRYPPNLNCGTEQVGNSGFINSPKYPKDYPNNADCAYFIKLDDKTTGAIKLRFFDFEVEDSDNCKADFLKVHNGENGYAPVIANLCGKQAVKPIITNGKAVYLHFVTDVALTARGFNISWERATCEEAGGMCAETCQYGELEDQRGTCQVSTMKCCKPTPQFVCGKRFITGDDYSTYVVGGQEAKPNSWPWMLSVLKNNQYACGATLLSDQWAVTSASCVKGELFVTIVAGEHDRLTASGDEVSVDTSYIIVHEQYRNFEPFPNNIALLKLSKKLKLGPKIFPVCFPELENMLFLQGDNCFITGWGWTQGTGDNTVLNEVAISPISNRMCSRSWESVLTTHICAGLGRTSACREDGGGPLVCKIDGKWYLAGVVSYGAPECKGSPTICTRVSKYKAWVDERIIEYGGY